jgi:hypothetical protein
VAFRAYYFLARPCRGNEVHSSALLKHENAFYRVNKGDPFEALSRCYKQGIVRRQFLRLRNGTPQHRQVLPPRTPMGLPHACAPTPSRQRERPLTNRPMRAWLYVAPDVTKRKKIVRLGLPRIIRLKENAPELDYSSFYGKTGTGRPTAL